MENSLVRDCHHDFYRRQWPHSAICIRCGEVLELCEECLEPIIHAHLMDCPVPDREREQRRLLRAHRA